MPLISTLGGATAQTFGGKIAYGGSAVYDASGDGLYMSPGTPFAYGTGDFTIEMWAYPTAFNNVLWHQGAESFYTTSINGFGRVTRTFNDRRYLMLYFNASGQVSLQLFGTDAYRTTTNTATLNAWNHVALVRASGVVRIYLNGTSSATAALSSNFSDTTTYSPYIGRYSYTATAGFTGYISNVRVSKSAYYLTSSFTPSRTPFTRTSQGASNVQLLLNQLTSDRLLTDSSSNNLTVTNATTAWNSKSPFLVPYVPFTTGTSISATVTPDVTTANEGDTITFTVAGTNTPNGTYYYTIEQTLAELTGADFSTGSLSGTFTISGNSGSFPLTSVRDLETDGDAVFAVYVRKDSITGQVLGNSAEILLTDTSLTPAFTVAPTSVDEGSSASFTVENVGADGTYFWTILNGTTANADFSATSGSFLVSGSTGGVDNGTGTFSVTTVADRTTEGSQTFQVQIRSGSVSGTVVLTSSSITVNDTSLTPSAVFLNNPNIAELAGNIGGLATNTTLRVSNLGPAGTYYWTVNNQSGTLTATDLTVGSTSGSFTTSTLNGSADIVFTAAVDQVAEPNNFQQFQVQIREGSTSGTILVTTSSSIVIYDSSVTISAVNPNPASEGNGLNITVSSMLGNTSGLVPGTYWLTFESTGSATAADVSGLPYSFSVVGGGNYFINGIVSIITFDGAESAETFKIGVRQGSPTGTLVGLSDVITINASIT